MRFSILINCHNQGDYINECVLSVLGQEYSDFEIIIVDSSEKKLETEKFKNKENLKYLHIKKFSDFPELNQMYKIQLGLNEANGEYICLLDGDDIFAKNKLHHLAKYIEKTKIILNQDLPTMMIKNKKFDLKPKKFKENNFFKKLIINWPQIYGTSSITIKKKILDDFFATAKPFEWKFLAIDAQLVIYCSIFYSINNQLKQITYKRKHEQNLGDIYLNIFSKLFWKRRECQHNFYFFLKKKRVYNFDFFITKMVNFFL